MSKKYKIIADGIFLMHAAVNAYMVVGTLIAFYFRSYAPVHVAFVLFVVFLNLAFDGCPFTKWERKYRLLHNAKTDFGETFYGHYVFGKCLGLSPSRHQIKVFLIFAKVIPGLIPVGILAGWY